MDEDAEGVIAAVSPVSTKVAELEATSNEAIAKNLSMMEELETYKRDAIIRENASGLAETQVEKLKDLVADVDFEDEATFSNKVATVKESYFTKKPADVADITEESDDGDTISEATGSMAQYLSAIQKTNKK